MAGRVGQKAPRSQVGGGQPLAPLLQSISDTWREGVGGLGEGAF